MYKYANDGNVETIDPARLTLGSVVRMVCHSGAVSAFDDSVVTGIYVSYFRSTHAFSQDKEHFATLAEALAKAGKDDYAYVKLARPYCYCNNPFESMPNWLVGVETYEAMGNRVCETHKVVVMSDGSYATYRAK
jgi:hypothetical protein